MSSSESDLHLRPDGVVLSRAMDSLITSEGLRQLDMVRIETGKLLRFYAQGSDPALIAQHVPEGRIIGGVAQAFIVLDPTTAQAHTQEQQLFKGRNVIFGQRLSESPAQIAEALRYHMRFGLEGVLLLNRNHEAPEDFRAALHDLLADLPLTCVIWQANTPLGKAGIGPEDHPFLAPEAPGKDRMVQPLPDPWRAPLGEALIFEIAKWRFLAQAQAVLMLDACDLLSEDSADIFARCQRTRTGILRLEGEMIYPWRIPPKAEPRFADHICRLFDSTKRIERWAIAPAKLDPARIWRQRRLLSLADPEIPTAGFQRAMAVKIPPKRGLPLAPKTGLIEDQQLIQRATTLGKRMPLRPPVPHLPTRAQVSRPRTAIVTTMKNEGPFILEWIAHHRAIGVDDFLVYTNDCTDGTDSLLQLLQEKGLLQHRQNPWQPGGTLKPQHAALQAAETEPVMMNCDWGICMDVDEFITIKIGDGSLDALYEAMGPANMISMTWRLFGNAEIDRFEDRFVTAQFTRCAPEIIRKPHHAWGFKTLFRNIDLYKKLGVHRPKGLRPELWHEVKWLNGSGKPMPQSMLRNGWRSTLESYGYDWVQLNHYAIRSTESFLVKRDRGRVNHVDRDQGLNYWFRMNHNIEEDHAIASISARVRQEYERLLCDPEIRAAHEHALACHRAKIAELQARPDYHAFYERLRSQRMQQLCRAQRHFGAAVFAAGPDAIPPDLALDNLPESFFFTLPDAQGTPEDAA